jgi:Fe-S cluster biogenesis protein NfuA
MTIRFTGGETKVRMLSAAPPAFPNALTRIITVSNDLKVRVARVLAEEVAPALQMDGGDVELLDISDGVAQVRLLGSCGGCPSTIQAVIMGLDQELCRRIPEIKYVEAVA